MSSRQSSDDVVVQSKAGSEQAEAPSGSGQGTSELIKQASGQLSDLVRAELRLAVAELKDKGRHAGKGVGMFGGAGLVALYGVGAAVAAIIAALALVMPVWSSALIVAVVLFAVAAALAVIGRKQTGQATPPLPEEAAESVKQDVATIKERAHR